MSWWGRTHRLGDFALFVNQRDKRMLKPKTPQKRPAGRLYGAGWQRFSAEKSTYPGSISDLLAKDLVSTSVTAPCTHRDIVKAIAAGAHTSHSSYSDRQCVTPTSLTSPPYYSGLPQARYSIPTRNAERLADYFCIVPTVRKLSWLCRIKSSPSSRRCYSYSSSTSPNDDRLAMAHPKARKSRLEL